MKFIAYVVKGLESLAAEEIKETLKNVEIQSIGDKYIIFESTSSFNDISKLGLIDDVGLLSDIPELDNAKSAIAKYRKLDDSFSVTLSIVKTTFDKILFLSNLVKEIESKYKWTYTPKFHENFDIRVFINQDIQHVSTRLFKQSLMHRSYKRVSNFGALRPTVASAMIYLSTNNKPNVKIVDNFCGSGTILCEAFIKGHQIYGGDIESKNVSYTFKNLKTLGFKSSNNIRNQDAMQTKFQDSFFDVAISNIPWGNQIKVGSITNLIDRSLIEYKRILKPSCRLCILTTSPELVVKYIKKYFQDKRIDTVNINLLGNSPTIVFTD